MDSILDRFVVVLCKLTARLPFWVIYGMSDILYVFIYYIARYRRKVVHQNLTRSFPEKSPEEIKRITKKFYHHLSDLGLETIKYHRMSEKEIDSRLKLKNPEIFEECYQQGKSFLLLGMHHNNWEWCGSMQRYLKAQFLVVYNPVRKNKALERFILDSRERFGGRSIPVHQSARVALEINNAKKPGALILIGDQTPLQNAQFWTTFLNQETAFFTGPMKIAVKTNQPVFFQHTRKTGRSRYEAIYYKLVDNPAEVEPEEILLAYIQKMEEIIKAEPEYWLWSHRRWKHKRPEGTELHPR
ncbi:MAG: lysophospholipid acyltransferase family protein [Methylococcaceae bacterium]|nr:lysophospholipid acyltransferase family protein [Prolixibacteraceae bacterium]